VAPIHFDDKFIKLKSFGLVSGSSNRIKSKIALLDKDWSITKSNDGLTVMKPSGTLFEIMRGQRNGRMSTVASFRLALVARRADLNHVHTQLWDTSQSKICRTMHMGSVNLQVAP